MDPLCEYSGRLAPNVVLDAQRRIICGCERRIRVRPDGHIARHQRPAVGALGAPATRPGPGCWATACPERVIAKRLCWRHYRRLLRLNIGALSAPPGAYRGAA